MPLATVWMPFSTAATARLVPAQDRRYAAHPSMVLPYSPRRMRTSLLAVIRCLDLHTAFSGWLGAHDAASVSLCADVLALAAYRPVPAQDSRRTAYLHVVWQPMLVGCGPGRWLMNGSLVLIS